MSTMQNHKSRIYIHILKCKCQSKAAHPIMYLENIQVCYVFCMCFVLLELYFEIH